MELSEQAIREQVRRALIEDVGDGDLTAELIPEEAHSEARVICRESATICGRDWFDQVFALLDDSIRIDWQISDGDRVEPNQLLCLLSGPSRPLLTGERTALNFLQSLSGTATLARRYADAVAGTGVKVLDTRKTIPGLRKAQKYAVNCGGCDNHRIGLYDGVLIKENHIAAAGSLAEAVAQARHHAPAGIPVEVEVENLQQLREALAAGADILLLDNMPPEQLREAVSISTGQARLEASGGITIDNIREIAETGVDYISIGELTKHLRSIDLSMRFTNAVAD
ncbi:MAG: carboxylating nicotinate-nucleotide diphosphorylase [Gammaproteobacteria bacterium]|nr:carboxylating nicotinate-nucleotide diphosphorylase [Gammaproteobacteria bacterium]MCW8839812.1 carboxylating nicotinate-nucleotide diphosphorylase [Gammaproteobacteria bacterium]MCW8927450.1 carboxylating nicotinate-nucleotide diphosphorylase [Gammaproteobacteria bacterium]MCW8958150.1 carboxylating nicotinate-nucleotide diphosphorylase [Gammaproteobacteria bacterium]MCW8973877.1 carboxylating nicotinate-nucleotide diphosphorylase [Gammaproteobacteria bacterium]